jgi:hypothetical protein
MDMKWLDWHKATELTKYDILPPSTWMGCLR